MSGGVPCTCTEPDKRQHWRVGDYKCNYSKFNGRHYTPSAYSQIWCLKCRGVWRTKAGYVESLKRMDATDRRAIGILS